MADLDPLIRVRKHAIDQKQKFLAQLYRQAEELENQKKSMLDQMQIEQQKVKEMGVEMLSYFGPYSQAAKERALEIDQARAVLEKRIDVVREDLRAAFAELKKIEITKERRDAEEQKEIDKKESDELDAIGVEAYRRRNQEED